MGGVRTDLNGRTSVPGLFAVGEVACTGVHGANRLASNSLLESVVFAWRVAAEIRDRGFAASAATFSGPRMQIDEQQGTVAMERTDLQKLMWASAGIYRAEAGLRDGLAQLGRWCVDGDCATARETANMLLLAKTILTAALERRESRGAHYREDFPAPSPALAHHILLQRAEAAA
jgi:L-aspartate oxidase